MVTAPMCLGDHWIGVLCVLHGPEERHCLEEILGFLVALASTAAPFFQAMERIEGLEIDNARLCAADQKITELVGCSKAMDQVRRIVKLVAPSPQPVLITGETGTGKEIVARLLHQLSGRSDGPLVIVDSPAIPTELFESEVFGHERGSFTGATNRRIGLMEEADSGTLFLDEVGDLSPANQARILRAIETGQFRRVGGSKDIVVDFRVVAATSKNLRAEIAKRRFREDLYHRLRAVQIYIPPLRERRDDIPQLAAYFLRESCVRRNRPELQLSREATRCLLEQPWPGNVRELRNNVEAAASLCQGALIGVDDLRLVAQERHVQESPTTLAEMEKRHILRALADCNGRAAQAAALLGIPRSTMYSKLKRYGIQKGR